jgi:hypothetical protein
LGFLESTGFSIKVNIGVKMFVLLKMYLFAYKRVCIEIFKVNS